MAAFRHVLTIPLALSSFVGVFYAIGKLMVFLSQPTKIPIHQTWIVNLLDDWSRLEATLLPLTIDAILIVLFILSHSLLRSDIVKSIWNKLGLTSATRSIYNLATAAAILVRQIPISYESQFIDRPEIIDSLSFQVLVNKWERIPAVTLWNFDADTSYSYWSYWTIHALAWIIIYGGSIVMDLPELTGVKQVENE